MVECRSAASAMPAKITGPTFAVREVNSPTRFDRMEWAGAFGDLGTLIPFVVAYIAVVKVDPFGVLFSLGRRDARLTALPAA